MTTSTSTISAVPVDERQVLVTGANGFVGRPLCRVLEERGWIVRAGVRKAATDFQLLRGNTVETGDLENQKNWPEILAGCRSVVHLASRVHVMRDKAADPLHRYLQTNTAATRRLTEAAAEAGVQRFIFVSTIKVNGDSNTAPFTEQNTPQPHDAYAISKYRAELALQKISRESDLEIVIIRPPLVYGPGVKANFFRLLQLVDRRLPMPFASLQNLRSFVSIDNLVDFICCCLEHPAAGNQTFLVSDDDDLSTPALLQTMASSMGKQLRLFSCPPSILRLLGRLLGRSAEIERLCGSLQIDTSKARKLLGWQPPFTVKQGMDRTVNWYFKQR